jgi:DHA1 family bicyclomycin/chloramphenicol resistance-like MFS transporter
VATVAVRARDGFLAALVLVTATGPLAVHLVLPVLPTLEQTFGVGQALAQAALSVALLVMAGGMLCYGPLSDRFGRRPVLFGGLGLLATGSVVCAFAPDITVLLAGRMLQAAGAGVGMVVARAVVRDVYNLDASASPLAYLTVAYAVSPALAPMVGGAIIEHLGWRATFGFAAVASVIILALVALGLPETRARQGAYVRGAYWRGLRQLARSRRFWGFAVNSAGTTSAFFAYVSSTSFLMGSLLHRPASEYGFYFLMIAGCYMLGNLCAGRLGARFRIDTYVVGGTSLQVAFTLVLAAGIALLPLSPLVMFAPLAAVTFFQGFSMPNSMAGAISVDRGLAGTASGITGFLQMTCGAITSELVAAAANGTPWPMVIATVGGTALALAAGIVAFRAGR